MHTPTIQTLHPEKGKTNKPVDAGKYAIVKNAMLGILRATPLTHTALIQSLQHRLKDKVAGNIDWYGMTVKLDLEARGIIQRSTSKPVVYTLKQPA